MKDILGILTVLLTIIGHVPYIIDTYKGKTKPHLLTWGLASIVVIIAFFGQLAKGSGSGAWGTGVTGLIVVIITLLAIKKGTKDVKVIDKVLFGAAILALIPWYLTKDPTLSVIIATMIDAFAFFPTLRKTISDSTSETLFTYALNILRHGISIFAIQQYNTATLIYPIYLLVLNVAMTYVILKPRKTA